jgi:hypothetical protein
MSPVSADITTSWLGSYMQGGPSKMIHAPLWKDTLPPGQSARAGFIGTAPSRPTFDTVSCG